MKLNQISSEYTLTDADDNVIGVAYVTKKDDDASLKLSLGDSLEFKSKEEVAAFLEQILNVMD